MFLVGMMGSGKSTVGSALARRLGRCFVDSDVEIERRAGKSIAQIFADDGETAFRALEERVLEELGSREAVVAALGGGAIAQPGASDRLARRGTVVFLRASPEQLVRRVGDASQRPLLRGLDCKGRLARLRELAAEREASYLTARIVVETDRATVEQVVSQILRRVEEIQRASEGGAEE